MSEPELDFFQAIPAGQFDPGTLSGSWQPVFSLPSYGVITAITQANPAQVTSAAHGLKTGSQVKITNVLGMVELNDREYIITVVDVDNFTLNGVDSTNFTAYDSGGNWQCYGGFPDNIKILEIFNGGAVAIDVSYDGINFHAMWPAGATLIIDLQTNHKDSPSYGAGTLYGRAGQNVWVRSAVHATWLTIGGFR